MSEVVMNGNSQHKIIDDSDDDIPLSKINKRKTVNNNDSDDEPLSKKHKKNAKLLSKSGDDKAHRIKQEKQLNSSSKSVSVKQEKKVVNNSRKSAPVKREKVTPKKEKKVDQEVVWEWWKEEKNDTGIKWTFLEHKGVLLAPEYEPLPSNVKFRYNGKEMKLQPAAEEIATFYAKMYDHEYTTKDVFNKNFMRDWTAAMTKEEKHTITDLKKCNFSEIQAYFKQLTEERKNLSKEEKQKLKAQNEAIINEYGYCMLDTYKQKIGNFRIEPPGLFRGRGNHPKMGTVKKRVMPEQVTINCSADSKIPQPPPGHKWKEVRHDNTVTWLAFWQENVQSHFKYVMLGASSRLKGEKDWKKYETARKLDERIEKIRNGYIADFKHNVMQIRQRAIALYFIDKLALRAGNEKGEDEADTVGCCTLRYEHINLSETEEDGNKTYYVEFDFLGKDSIRYQNRVTVPKQVYKNVKLFLKDKREGDKLFDRLTTQVLNNYLSELMEGLTAKVFRTYNASKTLEEQLNIMTKKSDTKEGKILSYNRANREVAILCNHQRAPPKSHEKSMENLQDKINKKKEEIDNIKKEAKTVKEQYQRKKDSAMKQKYEKLKTRMDKAKDMLQKLTIRQTDREENKEIALGTSKLNYLDPRITIAWCQKHEIDYKKVYNKTQLQKFQWAVDMTTKDYSFCDLNSDKFTNKLREKDDGDDEEDDEEDDE